MVKVVDALVEFQELSLKAGLSQELFHVAELGEGELFHLYTDLLNQCKVDRDQGFVNDLNHVFDLINQKDEVFGINVLCHNDFNPRNIAIRSSGELAIYDWELAFIGSPLRDMVEFLSFVVTDSWSDAQILEILELHRSKFSIIVAQDITFQQWSIEAKNALKILHRWTGHFLFAWGVDVELWVFRSHLQSIDANVKSVELMLDGFFVHIQSFVIPLLFANLLHMVCIKLNVLPILARPISMRWFGYGKTFRGFILLTIFTGFFAWGRSPIQCFKSIRSACHWNDSRICLRTWGAAKFIHQEAAGNWKWEARQAQILAISN